MWSLVTHRCGGFGQRLCSHPRGSDDVPGQWLSAFRTARNERQKRKPVWLGSESTHRRSASLRAIRSLWLFTSVGRHVATHRLIVMPSAWVDRPPSVSIGVVLEREFRPRCYDCILDGSVITARDAPGAMKDRVAQLWRVTDGLRSSRVWRGSEAPSTRRAPGN